MSRYCAAVKLFRPLYCCEVDWASALGYNNREALARASFVALKAVTASSVQVSV